MTKSEVAAALGVSEKTVARYIAAGRLPAQYVRGKTGQQLDIAEDDVKRFQIELHTPVEVPVETSAREVAPSASAEQVTTLARAQTESAPQKDAPELTPALTLSALARIVRAVMDEEQGGQGGTGGTGADKPRVPVESKLLLSLDEAVALSGVPRAQLDAARREGRLSARRIGRGFKIRRDELESFVAALWNQE